MENSDFLQKIEKNTKKFDDFLSKIWDLSGAKDCKSCRSRKMLSNEYLDAKFGFDTEENEPLKVWGVIQFIIQSSPYVSHAESLWERGNWDNSKGSPAQKSENGSISNL